MTTHLGGCLCGQIRFQASADPIAVSVCHCRDCQHGSGGGPNYIALISVAAFEITKGERKAPGDWLTYVNAAKGAQPGSNGSQPEAATNVSVRNQPAEPALKFQTAANTTD